MINDLNKSGSVYRDSDIAIIGAGTVGIILSSLLFKKGFSIITLESGSEYQETETHQLNQVVNKKSIYHSAQKGRFRCLGGTSTRWGGAILPFSSKDIELGGWPISNKEIKRYQKKVEDLFGVSAGNYDDPDIFFNNSDFIARYCKYPKFKNRNTSLIFSKDLNSQKGPNIWLNSTVNEFILKKKLLYKIKAYSKDGSNITIKAKKFIFAAGAIETTRLLLLLDQQNKNIISKKTTMLGKFFCDHISLPIATIKATDINQLNRIFSYNFNKDTKKLRIEMKKNSKLRKLLPPFFAHIPTSTNNDPAYKNIRRIFRLIQKKKIPKLKYFAVILKSLPWIFRVIWWRLIEKRFLFSDYLKLEIHLVIEQVSKISNKIILSKKKRDFFNRYLPEIHWKVNNEDFNNIILARNRLNHFWNNSYLSSLGKIKIKNKEDILKNIKKAGGIHHPTGSTRMSKFSKKGVVNKNLQLFSIKNVNIISTSTFPTGGGGNPTMTLIMLTMKFINSIKI